MHHHVRVFSALMLTLCLFSMPTYATEGVPMGVCVHHPVHDEACGFSVATPASECAHRHDIGCYVQACLHTEHNDACGFAEAVEAAPCMHEHDDEDCYQSTVACAHSEHTETCGYTEGEGCSHICCDELGCFTVQSLACLHVHDDACGYAAAIPAYACTHACTEESDCLALACPQEHDNACGFAEAAEGTPCTFICLECVRQTASPEPTAEPTVEPTEAPTAEPTAEPTEAPTDEPTAEPTVEPTEAPTAEPTTEPTVEPTETPTAEPTEAPTEAPTAEPTAEPTVEPTEAPTAEPTVEPTTEPTVEPTETPIEELPSLLSVAPTYTITFPTSLSFGLEGGSTVIQASAANLAEGQSIRITASSANEFTLCRDGEAVPYTLISDGQAIANGGTVTEFTTDGTQQLDFAVTGNPSAGVYTDTLTFTVSLTGGETTE